jgi:hypothetical protein
MRLSTRQKTRMDDVRKVALAALVSALDDRKEEAKRKPGLTGVRAVATGAVIYTAGKAAFSGRRFIREHLGSDGEPEARDDRDEDEEFDDDEPRAEEDEDYEDEDDYEEEPRQRRRDPSRRPPRHANRDPEDVPPVELPSRPSRSRAPVGRT